MRSENCTNLWEAWYGFIRWFDMSVYQNNSWQFILVACKLPNLGFSQSH